MGSLSRADETILSWLLVGRPIPALYQYSGNDGHSFRTEESHKIHTPLLCHDFYQQYNNGLLYQQTRKNTFSQPMRGGIGGPPLVSGTRYRYQCLSYSRQINKPASVAHLDAPSDWRPEGRWFNPRRGR